MIDGMFIRGEMWKCLRQHGNGRIESAWKMLGIRFGFTVTVAPLYWRWERWRD